MHNLVNVSIVTTICSINFCLQFTITADLKISPSKLAVLEKIKDELKFEFARLAKTRWPVSASLFQ